MISLISLLALFPVTASMPAYAGIPPVPELSQTPCYSQVLQILKGMTNFKIVDGGKIGTEFIDASDFRNLPTREYFGMTGQYHFGLVGYSRIDYHGDAVSHLYNYVVSATCTFDDASRKYVLDDQNYDGNLDEKDIDLHSMDFER